MDLNSSSRYGAEMVLCGVVTIRQNVAPSKKRSLFGDFQNLLWRMHLLGIYFIVQLEDQILALVLTALMLELSSVSFNKIPVLGFQDYF